MVQAEREIERRLALGPAAIGTLFGIAAVASTSMHPIFGRLSDRWGGRRLMLTGLITVISLVGWIFGH